MDDIKISTISKIYAQALLESVSSGSGISVEEIYNQLCEVIKVLDSSEDLRLIIENTSISQSKKLEILESVFGGKIDIKLLNFLKILVQKGRFGEISAIKASFKKSLDERSNLKTVEIYSPIELNFENKSNVLFKLEHKLNCEISPVWKIDKELIAGLAFKIGDTVVDTSLRAKLEDLSRNITK